MPENSLPLKLQTTLALLICFFSTCFACKSTNQGPEQWRFALEEVQGSIQDAYAQEFKRLIEKKSQGQIEVSVYPYGTLGTSDQITELVNNGAVHFAMASPGHLGKLIPEVQVFLLHFLFSDRDEVNKQVYGQLQNIEAFHKLYAQKGLKFLAFYPEGWMAWTTQSEIKQPDDFKGIKLRVMTSPLLLSSYYAYGASPVSMPYAEVYSGLQLKMIDGQVNPVFAIEEMSFYEVTDYLTFPRHAQFITSAIASLKFFNKARPERQQMITETIAELNDYIYKKQLEYNQERLKIIREKSKIQIQELSASERKAFADRYEKVRQEYIDMVGPQGEHILKQILEMTAQAEKQHSHLSKS